MPRIELGIGLFPTEPLDRVVELVELAERLGYADAWIGDSQLIWREAFLAMGAAAARTSRIRIGTGVTNPVTRDWTVLASGFAALNEMSKGRAVLGIGKGDSSLETMGRKPATLARLEESIRSIRRMIAGETVPHGPGQVHIPWAAPGARVPVVIGGSGPKMLELAGRVADGAIILVGIAPEFIRSALQAVERGAAQVGRKLDADGFKKICWVPMSVGVDGRAARDFVKSHVARTLKRPLPFELSQEDQQVVDRIYREYEYYEHMVVGAHHGELVPDHMVEKFAIAGTVDECAEQVRRLAQTGIDQIAIIPHTSEPAGRAEVMKLFAETIVPAAGL